MKQLMDLLQDAGEPLPPDLEDLDMLTPFGTTFRYDMLPSVHCFDRQRACEMVQRLRAWVEAKTHDVNAGE